MRLTGKILCGVLMLGTVGSGSAQTPEPEEVNIRFTLCLLPVNKSAYYKIDQSGNDSTATYVPPVLSYRNGSEQVDLRLVHGDSKKDLSYTGPPVLNFYRKGVQAGSTQPVGSVQLNPEWTEVLLLAISDPQGKGQYKISAMNAADLRLNPGDLYVYNSTSEEIFTAIGDVKHRLPRGHLQRFDCDVLSRRLKTVVMATQREGRFQSLFDSNMAFSRERSNLLLVYYEQQDPKRPRVKLVQGISL